MFMFNFLGLGGFGGMGRGVGALMHFGLSTLSLLGFCSTVPSGMVTSCKQWLAMWVVWPNCAARCRVRQVMLFMNCCVAALGQNFAAPFFGEDVDKAVSSPIDH